MSIKRGLLVLITGIAVGGAILWATDYYLHLNLIQRIDWQNILLWEYFVAGFGTACWLVLWSKFLRILFGFKKQKAPAAPKPTSANTPIDKPQDLPPARMNVQSHAVLSVAPTTDNTASADPLIPTTPSFASQPSQKSQDIEMLCKLEPDLDMMSFKHVNLEGKSIDLVYSSDTNALLCTIFSEPHTWTVDTSTDIEHSVWTDETGTSSQPCLLLLRQAAALEKMEPSSILTPTMILMRGTLQNAEEAIPYLKENHITIATYQPSDMPGAITITDLLQEQFAQFPPKYDVITENMPQDESSTEGDNDG